MYQWDSQKVHLEACQEFLRWVCKHVAGANDVDGLAAAIRALQGERARAMGARGRARVESGYEPTVIAHRVYDVLLEAAAERP